LWRRPAPPAASTAGNFTSPAISRSPCEIPAPRAASAATAPRWTTIPKSLAFLRRFSPRKSPKTTNNTKETRSLHRHVEESPDPRGFWPLTRLRADATTGQALRSIPPGALAPPRLGRKVYSWRPSIDVPRPVRGGMCIALCHPSIPARATKEPKANEAKPSLLSVILAPPSILAVTPASQFTQGPGGIPRGLMPDRGLPFRGIALRLRLRRAAK
jgi:hypothetical protein